MAEKRVMKTGKSTNVREAKSLTEKANSFYLAGYYIKAAAHYTQAIKLDPTNAYPYCNRALANLMLTRLSKALDDAETTIRLDPQWHWGYYRKGCVLEGMKKYADALAAFEMALQYNPQNTLVSGKIKSLKKDKLRKNV